MKTSLLGLVAKFPRPAIRPTLQPRVFFKSLWKRTREVEPAYESSDLLKLPSQAYEFKKKDLDLLRVSFKPASAENNVIPNVEGKNYFALTILLTNLMPKIKYCLSH